MPIRKIIFILYQFSHSISQSHLSAEPMRPYGELHFSSCNTRGITQLTLCRDTARRHRPVIGMLVHYPAHTACVGQFRYDRVVEVVPVEPTMGLYITIRGGG